MSIAVNWHPKKHCPLGFGDGRGGYKGLDGYGGLW